MLPGPDPKQVSIGKVAVKRPLSSLRDSLWPLTNNLSSPDLPSCHLHLPGAKPSPEHQRQKEGPREAWSLGSWASPGAAGPGVSSKALRSNGRV